MITITIESSGMGCNMCESHANEAIRNNFKVIRVKSSFKKGTTVILTEEDISDDKLRQAFAPTGYKILQISRSPYKQRWLFG